jgi:hypothetical protein
VNSSIRLDFMRKVVVGLHQHEVASSSQLKANSKDSCSSNQYLHIHFASFVVARKCVDNLRLFFQRHSTRDETNALFLLGEVSLEELLEVSTCLSWLRIMTYKLQDECNLSKLCYDDKLLLFSIHIFLGLQTLDELKKP